MIIYFLGVIPNFLPGIGLPSFFYVTISEVFKPNSFFFKERLKLSIYISMFGLKQYETFNSKNKKGLFSPSNNVSVTVE